MEKISAWLFLLIALVWIPQVGSLLGTANIWVQVIALAIVGILEIKASK